jgi:hypothetical protein
MADIVLAEFGGQAWLVGGEEYIDDLLANTLPQHITIELVACESKSDINLLWAQHSTAATEFDVPWLIHPAIVARERRRSAQHNVFFAQWSALIDDDARAVIRSAAGWAGQNAGSTVVLTRYVGAASAPGIAELANLRARLIEAELVRLGVAGERIEHETRDVASVPGMLEESQQINIAVRPK